MARIPTPAQQQASRQNGSKSHGPVTGEGKVRSARNASFEVMEKKYGLCASGKDQEMQLILSGLLEDLQPDGLMQTLLVERIAFFTWKIRRLERIEMQVLTGDMEAQPLINPTKAYLLDQIAARRRAHSGEPPVEPAKPSPDETYLRVFRSEDRLLDRLQSYELKLSKAINACLRELRRLKKSLATDETPMDTDSSGTAASPVRTSEASNGGNENDQNEPEEPSGNQNDRIEPEKPGSVSSQIDVDGEASVSPVARDRILSTCQSLSNAPGRRRPG